MEFGSLSELRNYVVYQHCQEDPFQWQNYSYYKIKHCIPF